MEKISIITTCYNCETYIQYALSSVLEQKTTDKFSIEYIIVNDCSTDNSLKKINNSITLYNNHENENNIDIKVITPEKNLGCGGARKFGIEAATGDYFMFLDSDDYYINKDFVSRAYEDIIKYEADIVEYGVKYNLINGQISYGNVQNVIEIKGKKSALISLYKDNIIRFNVWSKIYKRSIVESYPYSDTRTYEDVRTIPIWVSNAKKIIIMPTVEINYRANTSSIIRTNGIETRIGTIQAIAELFETFKDDYDVLKAMYSRAMVDLEYVMDGKTSYAEGFNVMSELNTKMLSYIYPDSWTEKTFNLPVNEQEKT